MSTKPLSKSSALGSLAYALAEPAASAVGGFLRDTAGEAIQGTYKWGRDKAYDAMTEHVSAPAPKERIASTYTKDGELISKGNEDEFTKTFGGLRTPQSDKWTKRINRGMEAGTLGEPRSSEPEYRPGGGGEAPQFLAHFTKTKFPDIAKPFYENPEAVGQLAGAATVLGGLGLAGGAVGLGMGALKPKSEYSVPVQPSGGYNQSVESAMASAGAKYELEEQKFQHNMALAQMREQSRIPGVQNTSVGAYGGSGMTSSAVMGLMQNQFGNTRQYF